MTNGSKRMKSFDMMKGVAIFLVVMGHVIAMCIREIDRTPLFKFIGLIHMPLFFFISGWFACRLDSEGRIKIPNLWNRAVRLLLPMIAVSTLWIFYFPHSGLQSPLNSTFEGLWSDSWKNGYWFTLVLFELFVVYWAIIPLLNQWKSAAGNIIVILCVWVLLLVAYCFCPQNICSWLSLDLTAAFFPAFMFGWVGRKLRDEFMQCIGDSWFQTFTIIVFAGTIYVSSWPWEFGLSPLSETVITSLFHISLAIIAMAVFGRWEQSAYSPDASPLSRRIADMWSYIGVNSLGIYLLHYFFLFPMGDLFRDYLESLNLSFVPMTVFSAFWATCIVAIVLGIIKLIQPSRPLSLLLTGQK